jgi:ATP-binding cassette subfamily F protein 3
LAAAPRIKPVRTVKPAAAKAARPADHSKLEAQIEAAESALAAVEDELAGPAAWSTPERSAASSAKHAAAKAAVEELYARYEQVAG